MNQQKKHNQPRKTLHIRRRVRHEPIRTRESHQTHPSDNFGKYRALIENSSDLIFVIAGNNRILSLNRPAAQFLGKDPEEVQGRSLFDVFPKKIASQYSTALAEVIMTGKGKFTDEEIVAGVRRFWASVSLNPVRNHEGKIYAVLGVTRDITERKRMEETLRESELRFRLMFENMGDAVAVYEVVDQGKDFVIRDFNKAAERIEKVRSEDVIGKSVMKVFPGVKEFGILDVFQKVWKTGKSERYPTGLYKDKRIVGWRENYVYKLPSSEVVAVYQDVTERKRMEENLKEYSEHLEKLVDERARKLRESEEKYRSIVRNIPAIVWTSNRNGDTLFISPNVQQILGYSPEEFCARGHEAWLSNIHPDDKERVNQAYSALFENGSVFDVECRYQRHDGKWIWLHDRSTVVYAKDGIECTDGVITDITERKRIEEELRAARERLEYVVSLNPAAIILGKPLPDGSDFTSTYMSQSVASVLGFEAEELIGQSGAELWASRVQPDDLRLYRAKIPLLWRDGHQSFDYRFLLKDGSYRWIHEEEKVIRDAEDQVRDVIGYYTDETERKRLEEELVKSQRLVAIAETTRMVGHDLRNPLQGIAGATGVLRKHLSSNADETILDMLDVLEKDVVYSNKIITDLLDYSRPIQITPVETRLRSILEQSLQMVSTPSNVTVENQAEDVRINVDPQIQRVFVNLIKNSYDAMPDGGLLRIGSKNLNGTIEISFSDTGRGFAEDVTRRLWKGPVTTKAKGLGLGLAISKRIVEAHGGSLLLENGPERGAIVRVRFPREPRVGGE